MPKYNLTVENYKGESKVYENVKDYAHTMEGLRIGKEDGSEIVIPKKEAKHIYVGMPTNENMVRKMNS